MGAREDLVFRVAEHRGVSASTRRMNITGVDARVPWILLSGRTWSLCVCRSDHDIPCVTPSREGVRLGAAWLEGWAVGPLATCCSRRHPRVRSSAPGGGRGLPLSHWLEDFRLDQQMGAGGWAEVNLLLL